MNADKKTISEFLLLSLLGQFFALAFLAGVGYFIGGPDRAILNILSLARPSELIQWGLVLGYSTINAFISYTIVSHRREARLNAEKSSP